MATECRCDVVRLLLALQELKQAVLDINPGEDLEGTVVGFRIRCPGL